MPQAVAVVVAKASDTTDVCHVLCDARPSCDTITQDQQAIAVAGEQAEAEQIQKEHDVRLKAKQQELARLQQQHIVTNTVKTLQQLLEVQFTQRLAVQSRCRSAVSSSGDSVDDSSPESHACGDSLISNEGSDSSEANTGSRPSTHSEDSSSSSTAASEATVTAESEDTTDDVTAAAAEFENPAAKYLQPAGNELTVVEAALEEAVDPLQRAATAAAAAALAGITSVQSSSRPSSRRCKPSTRRDDSWRSHKHPAAAAAAAGAAGAALPPVRAPCSVDGSIGSDSPRSTGTAASSRSTGSTAAASRRDAGDVRVVRGCSPNSRHPGRQQVSAAVAAAVAVDDADAPPPGFGPTVQQQVYRGRGAIQQPQSVAPSLSSSAAGLEGLTRPGFAAAVDVPPGFGAMKRVSSGHNIHQAQHARHSPRTASRSEISLSTSPGSTGGRSSSNIKPKKVGQSRLFQGALAGAMAERK